MRFCFLLRQTNHRDGETEASPRTFLALRENYSIWSMRGYTWSRAVFRPDVSFPPASARSGLPPPEPPTSLAVACMILPAWRLRGEVLCDPCQQSDFAVVDGAQHHDAGAQLLAQAVHELAHGFAVHAFDFGGDDFDAFDRCAPGRSNRPVSKARLCVSGLRAAFRAGAAFARRARWLRRGCLRSRPAARQTSRRSCWRALVIGQCWPCP